MSNKIIRVCVDRGLPPSKIVEVANKAVKENPANVPVFRFRAGFGVEPISPVRMALVTGKRWENGRTLRVGFLDGQPSVQSKVMEYAQQWSNYSNIKFEFVSASNAEIRIAFQSGGSWSYIGTDALGIDKNEQTMNFGWLTPESEDAEYSRVVIHEFGHALGCIHEHQNPATNIPWDKEAVYRYYSGPPNNWTRDQIDLNIFRKYSSTITQFSAFDRKSIMLYAIPNELTIGDYEVGWNRQLSEVDKEFIGTMYPLEDKPVTELTVGAPAVSASIGKHGEEDLFRFKVSKKGPYTIETKGKTDVVMALFGPNNQTDLLAEDDDSGSGRNAKIVTTLKQGTYYVRIRHYRPTGTGKYKISVKPE